LIAIIIEPAWLSGSRDTEHMLALHFRQKECSMTLGPKVYFFAIKILESRNIVRDEPVEEIFKKLYSHILRSAMKYNIGAKRVGVKASSNVTITAFELSVSI
jgi:hypothetical protein